MATIATPLRIGPADHGRTMTLEEFMEVEVEEGYRYELLHGVLVVSPWPLENERDPNDELGYLLRAYHNTHPEGTGVSVLEHLLGDRPTVLAEMGILLEQTRRMHPRVCRFISPNS